MSQLSTMPDKTAAPLTGPDGRREGRSEFRPIRVAVICDFLEEQWPSMDLTGDMLIRHLDAGYRGEIGVAQLRPPLRRRLKRVP